MSPAKTTTPRSTRSANSVGGSQSPLGVSAYDRSAALLVALLVLVGLFVAMLLVIWLTSRVFTTQTAVPVEFIEELSGRGDAALGSARDFEEPGMEEVEDLEEPRLEETLEALTEAISSQQAALDTFEGDARSTTKGRGLGDSRAAGPGGSGNIVPRWERWEIQYAAPTLAEYADRLDFFGVQLAAVGGGKDTIDYAYNLTKNPPERRSGDPENEKRLYMTWRHGPLRAADRELLTRAGVDSAGRLIVQFYPPQVEQQLAQLENAKLSGASLQAVKKTVFGVVGSPGAYRFVVLEQTRRADY